MTEYTPTTEEVRKVCILGHYPLPTVQQERQLGADFDLWVDKLRAEAKAEALEEAAEALNPELINYRRDAMEALSQRIQPAGGDDTLSLQLALVAATRTRDWLHSLANKAKEPTK